MKKALELWKIMRIRTKIVVAYVTVLLLSFLITFSIIFAINASYTKKAVTSAGTQTLTALKGNLLLIFGNVTQFSNSIYFDKNIQESLRNIESRSIDPSIQKTIKKSLVNMILSGEYISGVYVIDSYQNVYDSYKSLPRKINTDKINQTKWFKNIAKHNGDGFFINGSEGIIEYYGDKEYITYVREIRDENTYEPLAILLVTVDDQTIQSYFDEVKDTYKSEFSIKDGKGNDIIQSGKSKKILSNESIVLTQKMSIQDWKLVGTFPLDTIKVLAPYYSTVVIIIIFMNVLFVFICSMMLTRLVFHPLEKIEKHMLLVDKGQFVEMEISHEENEINNLKRVFNHMTQSIKDLISKVKEEEKVIAKGELDLIQAQINPHFLYNTLDAVSALALVKDFDNCFKMTQALGSFYRNSLNSGLDVVTVKDEIICIQSYITILNIRHDNKIKVEYEVEEELQSQKILKLLLQPLVENAVQHGINSKKNNGIISIKIFAADEEIILMVSDNGVGMEEDKITEIIEGKTQTGKSGFGIYSLKQRISLYYDIENPIIIHSELGSGTEVIARVKKLEGK